MLGERAPFANPFSVTKAVYLNDSQIQSLWVSVSGNAQEFSEFAKPTSHMPTFVMGAKGSGKTHLLRYHAFELQTLRYKQRKESLRTGVEKDGYIGIYARCGGMNSERFAGKRQSNEKWAVLFAYYTELWLAQNLLDVMIKLEVGSSDGDEAAFCDEVYGLFDKTPEFREVTVKGLFDFFAKQRKQLDYAINNCVMSGKLDVELLFTRGRLIFGVPKILASRYSFLSEVMFVYALDEFENLTESQQKFINTLVRENELPSTIRIGSRLYGVKTQGTFSDNEENLQNSEFEKLPLDTLFRTHKDRYSKFAKALVEKRLVAAYGLAEAPSASGGAFDWTSHFENIDWSWSSSVFLDIVKQKPSAERRHFTVLREKLIVYGLTESQSDLLIRLLSSAQHPLLEKACILFLFQEMYKGADPMQAASAISRLKDAMIRKENTKNKLEVLLSHYKGDLIAQLNRENDAKQAYVGLDTFIRMSAGLPRGLLTILRSIYEWSHFRGEAPLRGGKISKESQIRGVKEAADWFYDNMRKAGDDGVAIQTGVDRLARLFRANRFSDKPSDCSLVTFSFVEAEVDAAARRIVELAESRSFLNRIAGGQKDKNNERVMVKFQLNNMLSPRWDLPLGRRGVHNFSASEIEWIFNPNYEREFESFLDDWRDKRSAPFFGKKPRGGSTHLQQDLF